MNILTVGKTLDKLKHDALAAEPKVVEFFQKVEHVVLPLIEAIAAELVAKGTITKEQVDAFNALEHEGEELFKALAPLLEEAKKLG